MFWSDIDLDWKIIIVLMGLNSWLSFFLYRRYRNILLAVFAFSILGNSVFYFFASSTFFAVYHLLWMVIFTLHYWPYINLAGLVVLVAVFLKNHYAK